MAGNEQGRLGVRVAVAVGPGVALGVATGNLGVWVALGAAVGVGSELLWQRR